MCETRPIQVRRRQNVALNGRCLWIDASAGAAGEMLLGALLDAGASADSINERLAGLGVGGLRVAAAQVRRHGFRATKAEVAVGDGAAEGGPAGAGGVGAGGGRGSQGPTPRSLDEIFALLRAADLPPQVLALSEKVFAVLGEAEVRVHGLPRGDAHLHEAGALDALADVVGTAAALDSLGLLEPHCRVVVSRVALGAGSIESAHGTLPVPVPAVLEILARAGAPVVCGPTHDAELCTPTGAALLAALADGWGDLPALQVEAVGIGAGTADPPGRPNILRVVLGREMAAGGIGSDPAGWRDEEMLAVETTVDDLDPRLWPDVLEALVRAGSADAWLTPVVMRKGRPGHVVTALLVPGVLDAVARALFEHTTTLGFRVQRVERRALARDEITVSVDGRDVRVKRGLLDGRPVTIQPEYADAAAAAAALGVPVRVVLDRAAAAARLDLDSARKAADA
jgi:hypothetical protein